MATDTKQIVVCKILEAHLERFKNGECDAIHLIHSFINTIVEHNVMRVIEY